MKNKNIEMKIAMKRAGFVFIVKNYLWLSESVYRKTLY
jgi:hypothetical protein